MTILVTGARGNIGKHIVAKLAADGHSVRGSARDISGLQPPIVELDILKPDARAFDGVTGIFLYPTHGTPPSDFFKAALAAGVEYIVLLSSPDVYEGPADNPIRRAHLPIEEAVANSGLQYTVLYPGWLSTNALRDWAGQIRTTGRVGLAYPEAQFTPVHVADVAEVAVELLTRRAYPGCSLAVTGPESLSQSAMVAIISEVLGRPIPVDSLTRAQMHDQREPWMPAPVLDYLLDHTAAAVNVPAPVNNTVSRFTGHPPRPFHQWTTENLPAFTP